MKIHNCQQGTSEWLELRAGIPTASQFDNIITRGGKRSESQERYRLELLAERMMGHPISERFTLWMQRGNELEKQAISWYEFQRDIETVPVGFITNDAETYGASPDRFAGDRGMIEAKAPSEWIHLGYLLKSGKAYDKYMVQVQGQLLVVTDRDWVDVLSYHPEMPEALIRIERDDKFQSLLGEAVEEFSHNLELAWAQIVADGLADKQLRRAPVSAQDDLIRALKESLIEVQK